MDWKKSLNWFKLLAVKSSKTVQQKRIETPISETVVGEGKSKKSPLQLKRRI
jgi:hypothetical protein